MKREKVDFTIKQNNCIPGGSKEACIKVREYLQNIKQTQPEITVSSSCSVSNQEFVDAVKVLMAYAWQNRENDCLPDMWYCDNDCSNIDTCIFCPGEYQLAPKDENGKSLSKKLCPYFIDQGNI